MADAAQLTSEAASLLGDLRKMLEQDNRCLAADGPVGKFQEEVTDTELRKIYRLARG